MNPLATKPQPKPNPVVLEALKPFMKPGKVSEEDVQQRISARFINETVYCLQDGVIKSAQDGDVASIFGIGFPPFTGGPFRYIDSIGTSKYVDQLNRLRDQVPLVPFAACCLAASAAAFGLSQKGVVCALSLRMRRQCPRVMRANFDGSDLGDVARRPLRAGAAAC